MKILITGGFGFIGSWLCKTLLAKNYEIFVIDNLSQQVHGNTYKSINGVDFTYGDVSNIDTWKKFFNKHFDVLVHLAAETGTGQSEYEAEKYCKTNIQSTAIINDIVVNNKIQFDQIILTSSRAVYGDASLDENNLPLPSSETDATNPASIYGTTKLTQEYILLNGPLASRTCVLRLQNVYGVGQSINNPYTGIISIFSKLVKHNKNIEIFEDGLMSRDFVYVTDVIDSIMLCIDKKIVNQIYNVGTGRKISVLDVAHCINKNFDSKSKISVTGLKRKGDIRHNFADISKIKQIGYVPKISFETGIDKVTNWVKSIQTHNDNAYEQSLNQIKKNKLLHN